MVAVTPRALGVKPDNIVGYLVIRLFLKGRAEDIVIKQGVTLDEDIEEKKQLVDRILAEGVSYGTKIDLIGLSEQLVLTEYTIFSWELQGYTFSYKKR